MIEILKKGTRIKKIQVFDQPMCCSTGICGPSVDEKLVRFAADLDWLKNQGITVERYNLSQQPGEFGKSAQVKTTLEKDGNDCLPMIVVGDAVVSKGSYPTRPESKLIGLSTSDSPKLFTTEIRKLVAIGAAIACNCETCFKFHYDKARKLGLTDEDMLSAVDTGLMVKNASGDSIKELAYKYLKKQESKESQPTKESACCSGSKCC